MADRRATLLATLLAADPGREPTAIPHLAGRGTAPLSFPQQRLWFLDQLAGANPFYVEAAAIEIPGPVRRRALERSIDAVVARHDVLRTTFEEVGGEPLQRIAPELHVPLELADLTAVPAVDQPAAVASLAGDLAGRPFDLGRGPLLRTTLVRLRPDSHVFLIAIHHIVTDGWSMQVFGREVSALYASLLGATPVDLPELPIQYGDFAEFQRRSEHGAVVEEQLTYWREALDGLEQLALPLDRPRPAVLGYQGSQVELSVPAGSAERLRALCREEGVTVFMATLAVWAMVLGRHAGTPDVAIGVPIAGRERPEVEHLVGCFLNNLVMRIDLGGDPTGRQLLARTRATALGAYGHQDVPFERLVEELHPVRDLGRNPLFQVMFQFFDPVEAGTGGFPGARTVPRETAVVDLFLHLWDAGPTVHGKLEYSTELFEPATAARLARHFVVGLQDLAAHPDRPVAALRLAPAAELAEVRGHVAGPHREWGGPRSIHAGFAEQVARSPDAPALRSDDGAVTYRELAGLSDRTGARLRAAGVGGGDVVAIRLHRSIEAVAAMLAVSSIGASWVCVDPDHPDELAGYMLADSGASAVVSSRRLGTARLDATIPVVDVEDLDDAPETPPHPAGTAAGGRPAGTVTCLVYTSGSTGRPKAVMAEEAAIHNRLSWMWDEFPFCSDDVMVHRTALGFVDAVWEIMGPLLAGVPAVIVPERAARDPHELIDRLAACGATRVLMVPSQLQAVLDCGREVGLELPRLRTWFVSGEVLPSTLARRFHEYVPDGRLVNLYGSSEVAGDVSFSVRDGAGSGDPVTIGRPIANTELHVLDGAGRSTPMGVPGRLFVGGANVARGYWRRPRLTAERFVPDPFAGEPGARMYDTGDRVRWLERGELDYCGRVDRQIKRRGHRIELDGVTHVLHEHAGVRAAAVVTVATGGGLDRLVAFYEGDATPGDLQQHARRHLPGPAVPDQFVAAVELPRRPNGKIDPDRLVALAGDRPAAEDHVGPRNGVERAVAEIWRDVLDLRQVSMNDNFFDVGGHSLLATRVASLLRDRFGVTVPLQAVFEHSTAAELAAYLDGAVTAGG